MKIKKSSKIVKKVLPVIIASSLNINAAPIVRIFELTTDITRQNQYKAVGIENLTTSIKTEDGTLAMYTSHKKDNPSINYVVEIYENEEAYKNHAASAHFKKFVEMAATVVKGRKVFETEPQFLAEKKKAIYVEKNAKYNIRLAEITVIPEKNEEFKKIVTDEMKQSMEKEPGVLVMYAVTLKDEPNKWRFFEIYEDEKAYLKHRETSHFKKYIKETENMIVEKNLIELDGDTLVNKGGLNLQF